MTTYYYQPASGNWSDAKAWNTAADGSGDNASHPLPSDATADLNGKAVVLDVSPTLAAIQASGAAGQLTVSGSRAITADVNYSGSRTSGMIVLPNGTALTINGQVSNSGSGYAVWMPAGSNAPITVSNPGGTAVSCSNGRAISGSGTSTGAVTIVGDVVVSGGDYAIYTTGEANHSLTGNILKTGATAAWFCNATSLTINGRILGYDPFYTSSTTLNWIGTHTLAADEQVWWRIAGGTVNFGTAGTALLLTVLGRLTITKYDGNFSQSYGTVTLGSAAAQAAMYSNNAQVLAVTGPVLPDAANVLQGSGQYGYASDLQLPSYSGSGASLPIRIGQVIQ